MKVITLLTLFLQAWLMFSQQTTEPIKSVCDFATTTTPVCPTNQTFFEKCGPSNPDTCYLLDPEENYLSPNSCPPVGCYCKEGYAVIDPFIDTCVLKSDCP
uniref:TIL domain-containing protein n=1 Tax=Rhabditophanes sp. KR3021 TaxID=114890 RepID=A0AC35TIH7_9BILA